MPHVANKTSFKPGNTAALGNDKTIRITTWIDQELDRFIDEEDATVLGYDNTIANRRAIARRLVKMALQAKDTNLAMQAIREVMDRTEGKPKQSTELSGEVSIVTPIYSGKSFIEPSDD